MPNPAIYLQIGLETLLAVIPYLGADHGWE
jgi:hypothetical protein